MNNSPAAVGKNAELKKAFGIGSVCIVTYLMSYYMRNILGVVTPQLLNAESYTKESVALLSSVYMLVYAGGQLVNGFIGDVLKPKYMILVGYLLGGVALTSFPHVPSGVSQIACFAALGIGFSMLRGPLVKTISENTLPNYARVCCVFFSFSCHCGPLIASALAYFLDWKSVFTVSGIIAFIVAVGGFAALTLLEKRGAIKPYVPQGEKKTGLRGVFSIFTYPRFIMYMFIGMVVEIAASSITFWIPTYVNQYLAFDEKTAGLIFSAIALLKSICPFTTLFFFKLFGENDVRLMRIMFLISVALFGVMYLVPPTARFGNLIFLLLALMAVAVASSTLWSIYVPSLAKSGKVSGANGILDCSGYIGASAANIAFARIQGVFDWRGLIVAWGAVALIGALITFPAGKKKNDNA